MGLFDSASVGKQPHLYSTAQVVQQAATAEICCQFRHRFFLFYNIYCHVGGDMKGNKQFPEILNVYLINMKGRDPC